MNPHQIVIDVSWWQAVGIVFAGVSTGVMLIGGILRLWLQPQVGKWIEVALEREATATNGKIATLRASLEGCQRERADRYHRLESEMQKSESKLSKDIDEIKSGLAKVGELVPKMAEIKATVAELTKAVDRLVART